MSFRCNNYKTALTYLYTSAICNSGTVNVEKLSSLERKISGALKVLISFSSLKCTIITVEEPTRCLIAKILPIQKSLK